MVSKAKQGLREVTISLGGSWGDVTAKRDSDTGDFSLDLRGKKVQISPENLAIVKYESDQDNTDQAQALLFRHARPA